MLRPPQEQMAPSEQVMAEALAHRRAHLQQLGSLLRRRIEVNQYTVGTLGRSDTTQGSASSHASKLLQVLPLCQVAAMLPLLALLVRVAWGRPMQER